MRPRIKDPNLQKKICALLKKDGLDLLSALKRCIMDPDSIAEDEDDNASTKKFRYENEDIHSMGKRNDDLRFLELEDLGGMIDSFKKELNNPMFNHKNF